MVGAPSDRTPPAAKLVLAIDTCGPSGSAALGRLCCTGGRHAVEVAVEVINQVELEGKSYSATLVAAVGDLLARSGLRLKDAGCLVAVNGPGSFTGVRVGLSTVKGLAEAAEIPIVALSRLEVLAFKAGVPSSALDAHRSELFFRLGLSGRDTIEILAGAAELEALPNSPAEIAVCDNGSSALLERVWPAARLVRVSAPTAADALRVAAPRVVNGDFVDVLRLDGHYLRRSDAEIFGQATAATRP
jgi:tRNA threonylcarbamoyladenosine biosynthesis protein TsaB